jgi:23S rRNA (uracil747-C5)-methyltransferase
MKPTLPTGCVYFNRKECFSCSLLAIPEEARNRAKLATFEKNIESVLGSGLSLSALWQPKQSFQSRTKAKVSVTGTIKKPIIGLLNRNQQGTELLDCPLHIPQLNEVLSDLKRLITVCEIAPYHIDRRAGELKGFILKVDALGAQMIVRFVLRSTADLAKVKRAARELQKNFSFIKVVSANIQPLPAAIVEGDEEIALTKNEVIWEEFGKVKLAFQPQTFSQVTPETAVALYEKVLELLKINSVRSLLDLFCGVGGFSMVSAPVLDWGHGVELSKKSIACAKMSCKENGINNLNYEACNVEEFLKSYTGPIPDAVLLNPPRRGLSETIIEHVRRISPKFILYSSCNPDSMLRDLQLLQSKYSVKAIFPFDMFPLTEHLEVLTLLEKNRF